MNTVTEPIEILNSGIAGYLNADVAEIPVDRIWLGSQRSLLKCFSNGATVISFTWDEADHEDIALIKSRQAEPSEPLTGVLGDLGLGGGEIHRSD